MPQNAPDGKTRTSRVVGSVDFVRAELPPEPDGEKGGASLRVLTGIRCCVPFLIKCAAVNDSDVESLAKGVADDVFTAVETKLNSFNPDSELNTINDLPANDPRAMSDELGTVVLAAKEMIKMTRGAYDPAIAPLLYHYQSQAVQARQRSSDATGEDGLVKEAAGGASEERRGKYVYDVETLRSQRVVVKVMRSLMEQGFGSPTDNRVSKKVRGLMEVSQWRSAFSVGWYDESDRKVLTIPRPTFDKSRPFRNLIGPGQYTLKIAKLRDNARMDLNGIIKGWAVEEIARRLPSPCYVEWGGDVKVKGSHPSGR